MQPLVEPPLPTVAARVDQRVTLHGVSWQQFEALLSIRGDQSVPRIAYLEGELELMTPSRSHQFIKKTIARLLEAYAEEAGVELEGIGSWTVKEAPSEAGLEPDECYVLGRIDESDPPRRPDLAVEVVWTSGGLNKLEIYRRLRVPEVWMWKDSLLRVFVLHGKEYQERERSSLLPSLDLKLLSRFVNRSSQTQAVREYRHALREAQT